VSSNPENRETCIKEHSSTVQLNRSAIWKAPLHFRFLQALLIRNLHTSDHNYETRIQLPGKQKGNPMVVSEYYDNQWQPNYGASPGCNNIFRCLETGVGGGQSPAVNQTNAKCSATEKLLHINILELKAAFLGLKSLLKNHRSMTGLKSLLKNHRSMTGAFFEKGPFWEIIY
jgi:hypothetical protein